jgi:hypothetical protein
MAEDDDPADAFEAPEDGDGDDDGPFERLGETPPREGDPFARLDDPQPERGANPDGDIDPGPAADADQAGVGDAADRAGMSDVSGEAGTGAGPDSVGPDADAAAEDPFADFGDAPGDPFEGAESAFADVQGEEGVWERMDAPEESVVEDVTENRYVDVSKHGYCETCEHFSEPPEVHCTHEGTEILEFIDVETVRVRNCPVVEERRAIREEN